MSSYFIFGFALFYHELGHVSACRFFGARHGGIGFGFYLFTPVMFADVSDIWKLPQKERIIVNFGGIYFGNLFALIFIAFYQIFGNIYLLIIPLTLVFDSLVNLNPLIRYDGYWILSDFIGVPNLQKNAFLRLKNLFRSEERKKYAIKDCFLAFYAFISLGFIIFFAGTVLLLYPDSVLYFPQNVFKFIISVFNDWKSVKMSALFNFALPAIFYFLVIRFAYNFIKRQYGKKRNSVD